MLTSVTFGAGYESWTRFCSLEGSRWAVQLIPLKSRSAENWTLYLSVPNRAFYRWTTLRVTTLSKIEGWPERESNPHTLLGYSILSAARLPVPPPGLYFFIFLPLCVGCKLWQFGQSICRFSSLLSLLFPLMWSNSNGIRPSADFSAHLHFSHFSSLSFALNNLFFSL